MAEGIFRTLTKGNPKIGRIDSAGTSSYNTGCGPDTRTMATLADNGITGYDHEARSVHGNDFTQFDYILAMDRDNLHDLRTVQRRVARKAGSDAKMAKVMLFGDFGGALGEEVGDPYYGAVGGFEIAYEQLMRFSKGFVEKVLGHEAPTG